MGHTSSSLFQDGEEALGLKIGPDLLYVEEKFSGPVEGTF